MRLANQRQIRPYFNLTRGLIGFWPMGGSFPGAEKDCSGRRNDITWGSEPPYGIGPNGNCRQFNGSSHYGILPSTFHIPPQGTVCFQTNLANLTLGEVIGKDKANAGNHRILIGSGFVEFQVVNGATTKIDVAYVLNEYKIKHFVVFWGAGAGIYVDGILQAYSASNAYDDSASNVSIGCNMNEGSGRTWYTNSSLMNLFFYNRVLTAKEVTDLFIYTNNIWQKPTNSAVYLPNYATQRRTISPLGTRITSRQGY